MPQLWSGRFGPLAGPFFLAVGDDVPGRSSEESDENTDTNEQVDDGEYLARRCLWGDIAVPDGGQCYDREIQAIHSRKVLDLVIEPGAGANHDKREA